MREIRNEDENTNLLRSVDWFTIVLYLIMVVAGAVSIYAATYDYDKASMFDLSEFSGKQFLWAGLSFLIGFSLLLIDRRIYEAYAYPLYGFMILLLIVTIFVAPDIKGSSVPMASSSTVGATMPLPLASSCCPSCASSWKRRLAQPWFTRHSSLSSIVRACQVSCCLRH